MKSNIPAMIKVANIILNHIVILCKKSFFFLFSVTIYNTFGS